MIIPNDNPKTKFTLINLNSSLAKECQCICPDRILIFAILKEYSKYKLQRVRVIQNHLSNNDFTTQCHCPLTECVRIVKDLTEQYNLDNIYRLQLVE